MGWIELVYGDNLMLNDTVVCTIRLRADILVKVYRRRDFPSG